MICAHALVFLFCVPIKRTEIDVAGGFVDPRILSRSLEAFVDDNCRERKEESVQARWVGAERTVALQQSFIDILNIGKVGPFALR